MVASPSRRCSPGCSAGRRKRLAASRCGGTSADNPLLLWGRAGWGLLGGFLRSHRLHVVGGDRVEEMQATGEPFRREEPDDVPRGFERGTWGPILSTAGSPRTVADLDLDDAGSIRT